MTDTVVASLFPLASDGADTAEGANKDAPNAVGRAVFVEVSTASSEAASESAAGVKPQQSRV